MCLMAIYSVAFFKNPMNFPNTYLTHEHGVRTREFNPYIFWHFYVGFADLEWMERKFSLLTILRGSKGSLCKVHSFSSFVVSLKSSPAWPQNVSLYLCILCTLVQCRIKIPKSMYLISSTIFTTWIYHNNWPNVII